MAILRPHLNALDHKIILTKGNTWPCRVGLVQLKSLQALIIKPANLGYKLSKACAFHL